MSQALADQPLPTRCSTMETFDRATLLAQIETADNARTGVVSVNEVEIRGGVGAAIGQAA